MSEKTLKNIPKLRFPEFLNDGEWEEKKLSQIYTFKVTNSFSRDKLNYQNGLVKNIHYGDIHTKFSTLFDIEKELVPFINQSISLEKIKDENYCKESDIVFADASEDLEGVGASIEIINLNNEKLLSGLHTLLARQKKDKFIIGFGGYLFKSNKIRIQIQREAQGAKVLGISAIRLSNIDINYPKNKKEQTKITDCLSSIDSLISAQNQKVELLKGHKKGLLQNLFPKNDENIPKIRFPEFKNDGEWEEKQLDDIVKSYSSSIALNKLQLKVKGYPVYGADSIVGYIDEFQHENEYISIVKDGSGVGRLNFCQSQSSILGTLTCLKSKNEKLYSLKWIYYLLNTMDFSTYIKGAGIPHIYYSDYKNENILVPKIKEQQKIADCLTSIDEEINLKIQKVKSLKEYKKALLQQLFPSNEVNK